MLRKWGTFGVMKAFHFKNCDKDNQFFAIATLTYLNITKRCDFHTTP